MVHKYLYGGNEAETIEVSNEQIAAGLPVLLQVRRGSESALNQLLPEGGVSDGGNTSNNSRGSSGYTKRWSAAAPISQEPKERYFSKKDDIMSANSHSRQQKNWSYPEEEENEERDVFVPRRISSGFSRDGSNRLSMQFYGDQPGALKWVDAADKLMSNRVFSLSLPREHRRKEPLSQANLNVVPPTKTASDLERSTEYVVLKMDNKERLGIHVVPDYDQNGNDRGLLVQGIEPGKKVAQDGRLSVNDRIVEINERNLLNQSFNTVQEIFQESLKSPELRLRVVKQHRRLSQQQQQESSSTRSVNGVTKKQPPPVYPKPSSISHAKHPMHNKENIATVESEEKTSSKVTTALPTKKMPGTPHTGSNILMAVNTRKIGRLHELELTKGANGLGFTLTSRDNPIGGNFPIYIKNILPQGAAVEDGRLKCGDRLLSVNGVDLTGKTQKDAVDEFRKVPPGGKVKLVVSRQEDVQSKSENSGEVEVPVGSSMPCQTAVKPSIQHQQDCDVVDSGPKAVSSKPLSQGVDQSSVFPWRQREILTFDIPYHDSEKAGLGISVKGKTSTIAGQQKQGNNETSVDMGIFINSILHGGAASLDGRLRKNDQLLDVNGVSLLGLSNSAAMDTLRRAIVHTEGPKYGAITLTVARKIGNNHSHNSSGGSSSSVHQKQRRNSSSSLLTDSSASTAETFGRSEQDHTAPTSTDNSGNSEQSDNTVIFVPSSKTQSKPTPEIVPSRNPVLERLTGQLPTHNALRNESYYRATHQTSMMMMGGDNDRLTSRTINQPGGDMVIIEEDPPYSPTSENCVEVPSISGQKRGSTTSTQTTTDVTYDSQLSLNDADGFSRDAFGRQSMSEKRHATLDAKSTDTYKRNKKVREEREKQRIQENRRSTIGVVKVNSTDSIPYDERNEATMKNQFGPSLGMKKSSSLESLQTMVQEMQMAEDRVYRRGQVRSRGCNESFRAAVDRSYEAPHHVGMDPLPEDDGCHFPPRQSSLNSALDCKLMKQQQQNNKKKSSLLKGLGSMFRFGRHRKPATLEEIPSNQKSSTLAVTTAGVTVTEDEKERARKAAKEEQLRIQEQYKLLMQRQLELQQQQQQQPQTSVSQSNVRVHNGSSPSTQYIQTNINNNYIPMVNCGELKQMRQNQQQPQYKWVDRKSLFPPETKEEYFNGVHRQSIKHTANADQMFGKVANRAGEKYNPLLLPESNRYSHYVNYEEIQQHLNRRKQHYHSQRRDNRELSHRPVSNFYEYESVQTMMQNHAATAARPPFLDANMNGAATAATRNEFFPSSLYGSTRTRGYDQRSYPIYQNANIPYQTMQYASPPLSHKLQSQQQPPSPLQQFFYSGSATAAPLYTNIRPLTKTQGPYVGKVTIRDSHHYHHHHHYTNNSLGTKV